MATYRIGISSEFSLEAGVGIGTATPGNGLGDLRVDGTIKTEDLDVTGVSTFNRYTGFAVDNIEIGKDNRDLSLTGEHQTTGDIVVGVNSTFTVSVGATVDVGTVPSVSIGTHFSPPTGDINDRPEVPVEGTVRFNRDLNTLEFYNGVEWRQFTVSGKRGRGVFSGYTSPNQHAMQYIEIMTLGNSQDFGINTGGTLPTGNSDGTRGTFSGGAPSPYKNVIEYITIASTGDSIDFGDLSGNREHLGGVSSSSRGIFAGGLTPSQTNIMEYVQIMTLGNATDFGDLTTTEAGASTGSNGTTGIICSDGKIQQINIASTGDAINVGDDLFTGSYKPGGASSGTRVMWAGGYNGGPGSTDDIVNASIRGINFASVGNATEFGTLTRRRTQVGGGGSRTRGVWMGGRIEPSPSWVNIIDYVSLQSGGAAEDFGDLMHAVTNPYPVSDCHGGLGGH